LALADAAAFCAGVRTARALRGFSPKSASVSTEPANISRMACRTPETMVLVFVRSLLSAATVFCQVALVESTESADAMRACRIVMMSVAL